MSDGAALFAMKLGLSAVECQDCGASNEVGAAICQQCGVSFVASPSAKSLQHKRLQVHQSVIASFKDLLDVRLSMLPRATTLVDSQQHVNLIAEGDILSLDYLLRAITLLPTIDVSTIHAAHSKRTHDALAATYQAAEKAFDAYRTVYSVAPPAEFGEFHTLLVTLLSSVLSMYLHGTKAVFSMTLQAAAAESRHLQRALDEALQVITDLPGAFDSIDISGLNPSSVNERLATLAGTSAEFTHQGEIDLAAVVSASVAVHGDIRTASCAIHAHLRDLFEVDADTLGDEELYALIVMASALQASDRLVTVKRRSRFFAEALREAHRARPVQFEQSSRSAVPDIFASQADLLSIIEQLRLYDLPGLSRETRRMQLKDAYDNIAELVWRRPISLPLYAVLVLEGSVLSYQEIAEYTTFGEKVDWLKQRQSTRYVVALEGVSVLIRNAGSHGGVDVSGDKIRLSNINPRTKCKTEEQLTDEQFEARTRKMLDTCIALRTALDVFFIENWSVFQEDIHRALLAAPRLMIQNMKTTFGLWHLVQPHVELDGRTLRAHATVSSNGPVRSCRDYTSLCPVFAGLLPSASDVDFQVMRGDDPLCRIQSSLQPVREFERSTASTKDVMLLPALYALSITEGNEPSLDLPLRYRGAIAFNIGHMIWIDVARIGERRMTASTDPDAYRALLEDLSKRCQAYRRVVFSVPAPTSQVSLRNALIDAVGHFGRGVRTHRTALRQCQWSAFSGHDKHFFEAGRIASELRERTLADAKTVNGQD